MTSILKGPMKYDSIFALVGDSPIPLLALVEAIESDLTIFFYTPEKKQKVSNLKPYLLAMYPGQNFDFHELPSMNKPSLQVISIAEKFKNIFTYDPKNSAIFVSSGTTTMALSMWFHSQCKHYISIRRGLEFITWTHDQSSEKSHIVLDGSRLNLKNILFSMGWGYDEITKRLKSKNQIVNVPIEVSYNPAKGELSFLGIVVSDDAKSGEKLVSIMSSLLDEFGFNGARYVVRGKLSKRAKNLLHVGITHEN